LLLLCWAPTAKSVCLLALTALFFTLQLQIAAAVSELRSKGFLNYFGLQRFGIGAVPTHR
jgi:tRNA(Glu) U13 pseudouridine synthase TruD